MGTWVLIMWVFCCGVTSRIDSITSNLTYAECEKRGRAWNISSTSTGPGTGKNYVCLQRK